MGLRIGAPFLILAMEKIIKYLEDHKGYKGREIIIPIKRSEAGLYDKAVKHMFETRGAAFEVWRDNKVNFKLT